MLVALVALADRGAAWRIVRTAVPPEANGGWWAPDVPTAVFWRCRVAPAQADREVFWRSWAAQVAAATAVRPPSGRSDRICFFSRVFV